MTHDEGDQPPPLECSSLSFVIDPGLAEPTEAGHEHPEMHEGTEGPNRLTVHVPSETTRLSLGAASPAAQWNTDVGITGHTLSHIHFETKSHDKTVVSLGDSATTSDTVGLGNHPPRGTTGYAMVTESNAWHESKHQHYLISQTADISVRTMGPGKRAVVQADHGKVDVNGGKQVNVAGGGVAITGARLEVEDVRYNQPWQGQRPTEAASPANQIMLAIASGLAGLASLHHNPARTKYAPGSFTPTPRNWKDKGKWAAGHSSFAADLGKAIFMAAVPQSPAKSVRLVGEEKLVAMAGGEISIFGTAFASLGAGIWSTVAALSSSIKGTVLGGVAGAFTSLKGYRKTEASCEYGSVFVGAEKNVHLEAGHRETGNSAVGGDQAAHVASPDKLQCEGKHVAWFATPAGTKWGMLANATELAIGDAENPDKLEGAKIVNGRAVRISATEVKVTHGAEGYLSLVSNQCQIFAKNRYIRFKATSGPVTVKGGQKILMK